jgi:DNA mismatch repair ATPase MutL
MPQHLYEQIMELFRQAEIQRQQAEIQRQQAEIQRQAREEKWNKEEKERQTKRAEEEKERQAKQAEEEKVRRAKKAEEEKERQAKVAEELAQFRKEFNRGFAKIQDRIGEIIEEMVRGDIVGKFQKLDYEFTQCARRVEFENKKLRVAGEIDLFLEDGDLAMLIEVKTTLETADVKRHVERLEKYRRYANARRDKRRFVAAVAGALVPDEVRRFAQENGMYVIVQSGESVKIIKPPKGFKPHEW